VRIDQCTAQAKQIARAFFPSSEILCDLADWLAGRMN
jgi:hypothetical protein